MKRFFVPLIALFCAGAAQAKDWPSIPQIQEMYREDIMDILRASDEQKLQEVLTNHRKTVECLGQVTDMHMGAMGNIIGEVEEKLFSHPAILESYRASMRRVSQIDYFWNPDEKSCDRIRERFPKGSSK